VEIGAFKTPIPGIQPFYVDCFEEYAGEKCLLDFKGDACNLPFIDNSLEYVATSHVLEHVANPLMAITEWARVLIPGGIIYAVIPDKRYTWDKRRPSTTAEHMLEDFKNKVTQCDGTHITDFIDGITWEEYAPGRPLSEREAYRNILTESIKAGLDINIHFHVFDSNSFEGVVSVIEESNALNYNIELLDLVPQFPSSCPNGFLAVLKVKKTKISDFTKSLTNSFRYKISSDLLLRKGTKRHLRSR
jgi:SAM-dependent methyltransferase